ncbi:uncharacterized protein LOC122506525 [Leptopilina heterotoma]|uniref:uncharacterized protein LOC122506525 n=1 Tax=Leptopilina heterotoma TaxID=63436 RepID=UPI001CA9F489|nr:uncharacterized protein LOC122506525 [Leptopilina heterotoma]
MTQIPNFYNNEFAQTNQNNLQNQQNQQKQQTVPPQLISNMNPFNVNQAGSSYQNNPFQQYQQECFGGQQVPSQNLITNPYQQNPNTCSNAQGMQNQNYFGSLSQGLLDQFRSCMNSAAPIFILPNACPNPAPTTPQLPNSILGQNFGYPMNYHHPSIGIPYTSPVCIPYALPIPIYNNPSNQERKKCECCPKTEIVNETFKNPNIFNEFEEHRCKDPKDDTICAKKHCPASLNLQALASQFLAIAGIISCAATRLILRKVPGSNVIQSVDETINNAVLAINQLNKDKLLSESKNAQQINALINIHMNANPPSNIIPILTMIQLKVNLLKAHVEHLINRKLMENQGIGTEATGNLDPIVLAMKTDSELREFLAALREKECQERVNFNFAPYHAQRVLAENYLNNIQRKISQVEDEMNRRRNNSIPRTSIVNRLQCEFTNPCCYYNSSTLSASQRYGTFETSPTQTHDSPDPFIIQVRNPKRLNLKPHVGSPETTYQQTNDTENKNCCDKNSILETDEVTKPDETTLTTSVDKNNETDCDELKKSQNRIENSDDSIPSKESKEDQEKGEIETKTEKENGEQNVNSVAGKESQVEEKNCQDGTTVSEEFQNKKIDGDTEDEQEDDMTDIEERK